MSTDFGAFATVASSKVRQACPVTALSLLQHERCCQPIVTFCQRLDSLLGGGVPLEKITEISGEAAVGKTQLCLQLCVDAQIPPEFGGIGGQALFIDTEGSFRPERLADVATAAVTHCKNIAKSTSCEPRIKALESFTTQAILSGVHYKRCIEHIELVHVVQYLPQFLCDHPRVRLVLIDSIAFLFRYDFDNYILRSKLLHNISQTLRKIAVENNVAVVLTNQVTIKFSGDKGRVVPALGETWSYTPSIRVMLYRQENIRYASLLKSPSRQGGLAQFQVLKEGIRDTVT